MMVATTGAHADPDAATPPVRWRWGWASALAVALAMLVTTLRRGFVLQYDMAFVPSPPINARSLGLDGSVPRAVPMDFLVAIASRGLPADIVQKLLLLATPVLGVLGMWSLLRRAGVLAQIGGALAFSWNVYVYERLVLGQWSLLLGVGALPWVVSAALDARSGQPRSLRKLLLWLGFACAVAPTTGLLAVAVAAGLLWTRWRVLLAALSATVLFCAPWWLPGLLAVTRGVPDGAGVEAFAVRSDTPLGPLFSLLTFGGIWNGSVVPPGRDTWPVALAALVVLVVAGSGVAGLAREWGRAPVVGLAVVAASGLALAAIVVLPAGALALRRLLVAVPALGLLRDGQKLVALWLLLASICFGFGVARLARPIAMVLVLLPFALIPGLALGAGGRLVPVTYPADYLAVQQVVATSEVRGDVLVLPWHLYRSWSWNDRRIALDPMPRLLDRTIIVRDDLELADRTVAGEDPRVPLITARLATGQPLAPTLAGLGVGLVIVDADTAGGPVPVTALTGLREVFPGVHLRVYAVPAEVADRPPSNRALILTVDALAALTWWAIVASFAFGARPALLQFWRRRERNAS